MSARAGRSPAPARLRAVRTFGPTGAARPGSAVRSRVCFPLRLRDRHVDPCSDEACRSAARTGESFANDSADSTPTAAAPTCAGGVFPTATAHVVLGGVVGMAPDHRLSLRQ